MKRNLLTEAQFLSEARYLWDAGHRSLLLVAGEHNRVAGPDKLAAYADLLKQNEMDFLLSFEVGPLDEEGYRLLSEHGFVRGVLYQETYDLEIYAEMHPHGPKKKFDWRYEAPARALRLGVQGFGLGVLLGLAPDWKKDVAALYLHAQQLESEFGSFPLTFSFPRLRASEGFHPSLSGTSVQDIDFEKIIALTRILFPSAGLVLSTRETAEYRSRLLRSGVGITHISAGVSTAIGGYTQTAVAHTGQFEISDERSLSEVADETARMGFDLMGLAHNFSAVCFKP